MQQGMFQQRQTLVHTARLKRLRREKEVAFRSGDRDRFKALKYSFNKAVRDAKQQNTVKLQQQFTASDSVSVWGGGVQPNLPIQSPTTHTNLPTA